MDLGVLTSPLLIELLGLVHELENPLDHIGYLVLGFVVEVGVLYVYIRTQDPLQKLMHSYDALQG